jgi:hypothetical protein
MKKRPSGYGLPSRPSSAPASVDRDDGEAVTETISTREAQRRQVRDVETVKRSLEQARKANAQGDRQGEVSAALAALNAGATNYERVEALKRVCDGYEALSQFDRAEAFCRLLLSEFPGTAAAQQVARRKAVEREAAEKKAKSKSQTEPAEAAPAY